MRSSLTVATGRMSRTRLSGEYKQWVLEGGISTPLIVHWPKGIASSRRNQLAHTLYHEVKNVVVVDGSAFTFTSA
ncbi:MAG: hypothetical protein L0387_41775 [Acidobacteria bacterium]|nr:hypothetical protein [Acidobacteriota bacterium]